MVNILSIISVTITILFYMGSVVDCPKPVSVSDDWVLVETDVFSLKLPPGFDDKDVFEVDSRGGKWIRNEAAIGYEYGYYSPSLNTGSLPDHDFLYECGKNKSTDPKIIYYNPGKNYSVLAHWSKINDAGDQNTKLTVAATSRSQHDAPMLMAIINSVKINVEE